MLLFIAAAAVVIAAFVEVQLGVAAVVVVVAVAGHDNSIRLISSLEFRSKSTSHSQIDLFITKGIQSAANDNNSLVCTL